MARKKQTPKKKSAAKKTTAPVVKEPVPAEEKVVPTVNASEPVA